MTKESYKSSNFALSFLFLDNKQRYALSVIYSFMRYADDVVDLQKRQDMIEEIEEKLNDIYLGRNVKGAVLSGLREVIDAYKIPKYVFTDLLRGLKKDLYAVDIKTIDELEDYMYCVAGTVGIIVLMIVGYNGNNFDDIARFTGYAVQMTNILRDIKQDLKANKIYIPAEHRVMFLGTSRLLTDLPKFRDLFDFEKKIAFSYYQMSDEFFKKNKTKELLVPSIMKNIYRELLFSLSFDNSEKNHKISNYRKVKAIFRSFKEIFL